MTASENKQQIKLYLLFVFYIFLGVIVFGILVGIAKWESARQAEIRMNAFYTSVSDLAKISEITITDRLREFDNTLIVLRTAFVHSKEDFFKNLNFFRKGILSDTEVLVVLVDRDGYLLFTDAPEVKPRIYLGDREYFKFFADGGKDRLYIDEPTFGRVTKRYTLPLARPIYSNNGEFLGVVAISVKQKTLGNFESQLQLSGDAVITIVNTGGAVVTRSHNLEKVQNKKISPELLKRILEKDQGIFSTEFTFEKIEQVIAFHHIKSTPLIIYVEKSSSEVLNLIKNQDNMLIFSSCVISFLIVLIVIIYIRKKRVTSKFIEIQTAHLRETQKMANMGNWELDVGTFKFKWSEEIYRIFGVSPDTFVPDLENFLLLVTDKERNEVRHYLTITAMKENISFEHSIRRPDGELIYVLHRCEFKCDEFGRTISIIATIQDITGRKKKEEEYQTFILSSLDGFFILDMHGKFLEANNAYYKMMGYNSNELLNMSIFEVEIIENFDTIKNHIAEVCKNGYDQFDTKHKCKNGKIIDLEINVRYIPTYGGRLFVFAKDVTERKKLQKQLIHSEKLSAIGQLAAGIAHEFNNILAVSDCNAQLLKIMGTEPEKDSEDDFLQCVNNILLSNKRGAEIVKSMMMIAKPLQPHVSPTKISEIIDEVIKIQKRQMKIENIKIIKDYSPDTEKEGFYDRGQLQQVFLNLIINARHAMKQNGMGEIRISIRESQTEKIISVQDTGIGISEENQNKIFTPFFTTKGVYSNDNLGINGSGLGLSVSYQIISNHNGSIRVESKEMCGAKFIITLPFFADKSYAENKINKENVNIDKINDIKILIIDDEKLFLEIVKKLFNKMCFNNVYLASSGKQALKIINEIDIDVIFLDLLLPDMNGEQIYDEINKLNRAIPIIFMSGQLGLNGDDLKNNKRAYAYVSKPFNMDDIIVLLNSIKKT
ncbi:PAS domain S-box protein [Candidatus Dependentiae bacterium]|nr:PAS domain S-box protein [Candidatus Dependentiae bacterium]